MFCWKGENHITMNCKLKLKYWEVVLKLSGPRSETKPRENRNATCQVKLVS